MGGHFLLAFRAPRTVAAGPRGPADNGKSSPPKRKGKEIIQVRVETLLPFLATPTRADEVLYCWLIYARLGSIVALLSRVL
jgi:hypothetical protein